MHTRLIFILIIAATTGTFLGVLAVKEQHAVNEYLWHGKGIRVPLALLGSNEDAKLAYEIGDSYFVDAAPGEYDLERAEQYYIRALELNPNFSNPWMQLGRIDFINGKFHTAVLKYNKVVEGKEEIEPAQYTGFFYWRGLANGYLGRFDESEIDFLNVIEGNKRNTGVGSWAAYADLAWVYFQRGKFEEIRSIMEEAVVVYPDNPWVLTMYGISLYNLGRVEEAQPYLTRAEEEAEKLTPEEWARSYPGNDPLEAPAGLANLLEAIRYNADLATETK